MKDFFGFRKMITSYFIMGFYVLGAVAIPILAFTGMIGLLGLGLDDRSSSGIGGIGSGIGGIIVTILVIIVAEIAFRLTCEGIILIFSLLRELTTANALLKIIADNSSKPVTPPIQSRAPGQVRPPAAAPGPGQGRPTAASGQRTT